MIDFYEKVAVVTGAASGLGLGIAMELLKRSAKVVLLDNDKPRLETVGKSLSGTFLCHEADVTNLAKMKDVFSVVVSEFGRIDYVFNNAGIGGTLPFEEATEEQWKKIVNLNLFGVINGITASLPIMKKQQSGHIINTSSISGLIPFSGQALYNTTKFAVAGLSLTLERELKRDNIGISIICPGMVRTRIFYKPIVGDEAPEEFVNIPSEAIPIDEAVKDIFEGIEKKKRIIITPKFLKRLYRKYRIWGKY